MTSFRAPTLYVNAEGDMDGHANASARPARRGRRPWHVRTLFVREPGDLTVGQQRQYTLHWSVSGRRGAV